MFMSATVLAALVSTATAKWDKPANKTTNHLQDAAYCGEACATINLLEVKANVGGVWCNEGGIDYEKDPGGWCFYQTNCIAGVCHEANEDVIANGVYYCRTTGEGAGQLYYNNGDTEPGDFLDLGVYCTNFGTSSEDIEQELSLEDTSCEPNVCGTINLPLVDPVVQGVWCNTVGGISYVKPADLSQFCFQSTNCPENLCHTANEDHIVNGVYYCKKNEPGVGQLYYRGEDSEPAGFLDDFCTVFTDPITVI